MDFDDVFKRYTHKNRILFHKDSESIRHLHNQLQASNRKIIILWAFDCAKEILKSFEKTYPNESKARTCIDLCEKWAFGEIKMKQAKQAILDLHTQAKRCNNISFKMNCHAIAQACSCVHTPKHALGLPMYELSAMVYKLGIQDFSIEVTNKIRFYENRLIHWKQSWMNENLIWASFIEDKGNK